MFVIVNSIKQMFRTPVRTVAFLLLVTLAVALTVIGINLRLVNEQNMQTYDSVFKTVGTVEQLPEGPPELITIYDNYGNVMGGGIHTSYGEVVSANILDFDWADYIHAPKQRPYYGAYHENYILYTDDMPMGKKPTNRVIIEAEPLEDCDPSFPVKLRLKRVICGSFLVENSYTDEFWFCDAWNSETYPMYAGKTYILPVSSSYAFIFPELESEGGYVYVSDYHTNNIRTLQLNRNGNRLPDELNIDISIWEEVTDGFYDTLRGQRWLALVKGFDRLNKTIPVMPVDATHLLMDFYNGESNVIDGRDICKQEYESGSRVCLVQQGFAKLNGIKVGDSLSLPLYYADYSQDVSAAFPYDVFSYGINHLNAQGEIYPIFDNEEYTVVGIYTPGIGAGGNNMVIIPAASVLNSDENNIYSVGIMQAYNTTFEIPNGSMEIFMDMWDSERLGNLDIRIYDKGYSQLKAGTENIRTMSTALLIVGSSVTVLTLVFFTFIYTVTNRKKTAIERSLGLGTGICGRAQFCTMMLPIVFGVAVGSIIGYLLCGIIAGWAIALGGEELFDLSYSNWISYTNKPIHTEMDFADFSIITVVACLVLVISFFIVIISIWINSKSVSLSLLCRIDD